MGDLVLSHFDLPITFITLNRAARHNSLISTLLEEMLQSLNTIETDPEVQWDR